MSSTIEYRNHTIKIVQDDSPSNPMEDWDINAYVAVYHDRSTTVYDDAKTLFNSSDDELEAPTFSKELIRKNWKEIVNVVHSWENTLLSFFREFLDYDLNNYDDIEYMFEEALSNALSSSLNRSERTNALVELYNMHPEFAAYTETGRGHSQSDWHDILLVMAISENGGTKAETQAYLEGIANVYRQWAYGSVYGFIIEDEDGDEVESCWGFHADFEDDNYNELISECKGIVNGNITQLELDLTGTV